MAQALLSDPIDLLLDNNDDLFITTDLAWATGVQAVAQECRIALQMFAGEWFMDLTFGYPYWTRILGQKPDVAIAAARSVTRSVLLNINNVTDVPTLSVTYNPSPRGLVISWVVSTQFGDTPVDTISVLAQGNPTGINTSGISGGPQ